MDKKNIIRTREGCFLLFAVKIISLNINYVMKLFCLFTQCYSHLRICDTATILLTLFFILLYIHPLTSTFYVLLVSYFTFHFQQNFHIAMDIVFYTAIPKGNICLWFPHVAFLTLNAYELVWVLYQSSFN